MVIQFHIGMPGSCCSHSPNRDYCGDGFSGDQDYFLHQISVQSKYHSTETWNTNAVMLKDSSNPLYEDVMRWGTGYLFFMLLSSPIVTSLLNLSQVKFMNPWFWYKRRVWRFNLWELQTQFWKPCQVSGHTLWHNSKQIIWETLYTVFLKWLILKLYPCHPSKFIHIYSF